MSRMDLESAWQEAATRPAVAGEAPAVAAYRRLYSGIRWAPLPVMDASFSARLLAHPELKIAPEDARLERGLTPLLFATLGISGGLTAGPQLAALAGQLAFDAAGLPWLQTAAAFAAIAFAAAVDRMLSRRRQVA